MKPPLTFLLALTFILFFAFPPMPSNVKRKYYEYKEESPKEYYEREYQPWKDPRHQTNKEANEMKRMFDNCRARGAIC
jgi:hypothetical protein